MALCPLRLGGRKKAERTPVVRRGGRDAHVTRGRLAIGAGAKGTRRHSPGGPAPCVGRGLRHPPECLVLEPERNKEETKSQKWRQSPRDGSTARSAGRRRTDRSPPLAMKVKCLRKGGSATAFLGAGGRAKVSFQKASEGSCEKSPRAGQGARRAGRHLRIPVGGRARRPAVILAQEPGLVRPLSGCRGPVLREEACDMFAVTVPSPTRGRRADHLASVCT